MWLPLIPGAQCLPAMGLTLPNTRTDRVSPPLAFWRGASTTRERRIRVTLSFEIPPTGRKQQDTRATVQSDPVQFQRVFLLHHLFSFPPPPPQGSWCVFLAPLAPFLLVHSLGSSWGPCWYLQMTCRRTRQTNSRISICLDHPPQPN